MKKIISSFIILLALAATAHAQSFEGKIVYRNAIKLQPGVESQFTEAQLDSAMGTEQTYLTNGVTYKSTYNGTAEQFEFYEPKDNRIYSKSPGSDIVYWNDAAINNDQGFIDSVLTTELNKNAEVVLGYMCDELTLVCKSGVHKYYFNSKFGADAKNYVNHKYDNWYDYLKLANALPLKMIIDTKAFTLTSTATEITPMKIDNKEFQLAEGLKIMKMN